MLDRNHFIKTFRDLPLASMLILPDAPNFTIEHVNNSFLSLTNTTIETLVGKHLSAALNSSFDDWNEQNQSILQDSLNRALVSGMPDIMPVIQYNISIEGSNKKQLKYWESENIPLLDNNGNVTLIIHSVYDVTERILLDKRKRELDNRTSLLHQLNPIASWEMNIKTNEITWSEEFFRICGYDSKTFIPDFNSVLEMIHPEDKEFVINAFDRIKKTGESYSFQNRLIKTSGEIISILSMGIAIKNEVGKIIKLAGIVQNISDIRRNEEIHYKTVRELKDRNKFIEAIIENLPIGVAVYKLSTKERTIENKAYSSIYGLKNKKGDFESEIVNKIELEQVFTKAVKEQIKDDIDSGDKSKMIWDGLKITTEDGEQKILNVKSIPLFEQDLIISTVIDDTERVRAAALIKESNQRFEYVVKATSQIIWEWDLIKDEFIISDIFKKIFGFETENGTISLEFIFDKIHPKDKERINSRVEEILEGSETIFEEQFQFIKGDGSLAHVINKGIVLRNDEGKAIKIIGSLRDTSKKKKEQLRLKFLETVITNTNDAVLITEAEPFDEPFGPQILYVNKAFERMTGYTLDEVIGKSPRMFQGIKTNKDELTVFKEKIKKWESCEMTLVNYKKTGEEFWVHISVSPVADENGWFTHWVAIQRDITKQKQEETRLKLVESVIANMMDSVVMTEADPMNFPGPRIVYVNKAFTKLTGYTIEEVLGLTPRILQGPLSNIAMRSQLKKGFRELKAQEFSTVNYKKNHEPFWIHASISPVKDENGICTHWVAIQRDVTEQKKAQIELEKLNEDLKDQHKQVMAINAELEQFAYVASHDLQEPLRTVTSFLALLEKKYDDQIDDKGKMYIHFAVDGAKRMLSVIQDLLEYSRAGKHSSVSELLNLNEIIQETKLLFAKQIEDKDASILSDKLPNIIAQKTPILQIFQNLIGNALKYSKKEDAVVINITAEELVTHWHFIVSDNGIGISEEHFEKIFVIFQRLHQKDEYSGTGIGLAITKKVIENMGGKIWVESEVGSGSRFHFTISKNIG